MSTAEGPAHDVVVRLAPLAPTVDRTVRTVVMQARPTRQRKNRPTPGLVSLRTAVVVALALAVGAVTAKLAYLAGEDPARIALTSLGAAGAAIYFFHSTID